MSKVLIVYGTTYGQTAKISDYISNELKKLNHTTEVYDSETVPVWVAPETFDAIMIGGSVISGGYQRPLANWIKKNSAQLAKRPSAFFSTCLGILQQEEAVKQEEIKLVKDLFFRTNWYPQIWTIFAGSLLYTKYNWLVRRVMRRISKKAGGETDMTRDFEYTNWDDVQKFVQDFSVQLSVLQISGSASAKPH